MTRSLSGITLLLGVLFLAPKPARADDLADQAELEFSLGAEAYQRSEYKLALEHFLSSNRLVPNKNVVFNIARSYEQLKSYPAAFRYYSLALENESDREAKTRISAALSQIKQYVMVLRITTRPAGATLYIDRKDLGARGYTTVSGLARGIDGAAHQGALPATIGVIASGIDVAYPPQHEELQERIAREGLLIAEQPPGTEPRGSHFPSRNRIIAGLALGTLVVEAAPRSGSLITARLAGEAGREVMAIPGSPLDARSHGCNQLIREGAVLVQTPDDVVELLSAFDGTPRCRIASRAKACWSPSNPQAPSRAAATSRAATGSSPGSRPARWWSKPRPSRGR